MVATVLLVTAVWSAIGHANRSSNSRCYEGSTCTGDGQYKVSASGSSDSLFCIKQMQVFFVGIFC